MSNADDAAILAQLAQGNLELSVRKALLASVKGYKAQEIAKVLCGASSHNPQARKAARELQGWAKVPTKFGSFKTE